MSGKGSKLMPIRLSRPCLFGSLVAAFGLLHAHGQPQAGIPLSRALAEGKISAQFRGEDVKSVRVHVALAGSAKPFGLVVPAGTALVAAAPPVLSLTTSRDHNACLREWRSAHRPRAQLRGGGAGDTCPRGCRACICLPGGLYCPELNSSLSWRRACFPGPLLPLTPRPIPSVSCSTGGVCRFHFSPLFGLVFMAACQLQRVFRPSVGLALWPEEASPGWWRVTASFL